MNKWIKRVVTTLLIATHFVIIPVVSADSLGDIQSQKKTVETELKQVQKDLNEKLSEASELTIALEQQAQEIEAQENSIKETEAEVAEQEIIVEKRYEYIADQLKVMQKSEVNHNIILGLFQAESLSDLMNKLYTATILTSANEAHLTEAHLEYEKLNELQEELVVYKESLNEKKAETMQKKEALDEMLAGLKSTVATQQNQLDKLKNQEAEIQAKRAAAKKVEVTKPIKTTSSAQQGKAASKPASKPADAPSGEAGSWMTFESTAYSYQEPGLSTKTASGVNLLDNPRVVAVDPSQIPLGSLVEVEGMGVYLAADTGGAINGKIIDVHFSNLNDVRKWGRRNVRIRVLN